MSATMATTKTHAKTHAQHTVRAPRSAFPAHARLFAHHVPATTAPVPVIRKNAATLTKAEQDVFKNAITKAIKDGIYARLVQIHADMMHDMHTMPVMPAGTMRFLPWHRLFLIKFEQTMRSFEPSFSLPHWRWMDQKNIPDWLQSFKPNGTKRDPGGDPQAPRLPTKATIESTVMNQNDYRSFTLALEGAKPFGAHNLVHVWFHGTMSVVPTAPRDPMFWMNHAEIDRIWAIWSRDNRGQLPTLSGAKAILDPWHESFKDVLDTGDGSYDYSYDFMTL